MSHICLLGFFPSNTTLVPSDTFWIVLFPQRSALCRPLIVETHCHHSPPAGPVKVKAAWVWTHSAAWCHMCPGLDQILNSGLWIKNIEVCLKWVKQWWSIGPDLLQNSRAESSGHTLLLGCPSDGVLEGFAAGVVSSTHSTFVLLLRGAEQAVTAHFLFTDRWKVSFFWPEWRLLSHSDTGRPLTSHSPRTHTLWGSL